MWRTPPGWSACVSAWFDCRKGLSAQVWVGRRFIPDFSPIA